ncbi:MAG: GntR family transcriptional regulator [Victivallaceae bacterium]|nr:GntR family transcriptional regulator [Victivallaceae bacterium]
MPPHSASKTEQLKEQLIEDIRSGVYHPGDAIPSVRQLCLQYQVSKHTVSQALSNLKELQLIEVAHGKTSRVRSNPGWKRIELLFFGYGNLEQQDFWSEFYRGIAEEAEFYPQYSLHVSGLSSEHMASFLETFRQVSACGALVLGTAKVEALNALQQFAIPLLCVHDFNRASGIDAVTVNCEAALQEAVRLLKEKKRRKVAFFYADPHLMPSLDGINAFKTRVVCDTLLKAGLMPDRSYIRKTYSSGDAGYRMLKEMLGQGCTPDAVVLFSDELAPSVCRAAYDLKISLPQEMSLLGFDNLGCGQYTIPSLTTIDVRRREQGRCAFRHLIEAIENGTPPKGEIFQGELIRRESL